MKKILLATFCILLFARGSAVWAQTPTSAATNSADKTNKIEELKDRLATVVAELRHTERRAISGTIKSTSLTTAVIETKTKDLKIELDDNLTVFQVIAGKRTKLTVDDISQGDTVAVFGEYDTTLDLLKAKVIFIQSRLPTFISGSVTQVNTKGFTLSLQTNNGPLYIVDIEKNTLIQAWRGTETLEKSGFSKISIGDIAHVVGVLDTKEANRLSATRILDLGNLTGATPTPTATATPTSSPSATPKPTL